MVQTEPNVRLRWNAPAQARGRATRERLLAAAERLLATTGFEQLTIADICTAAEANTGSFYHLFADKQALLECLLQDFEAERAAACADARQQFRTAGSNLRARVHAMVTGSLAVHRARPGINRARFWDDRAALLPGAARRRRANLRILRNWFAALLECRAEIIHPDPELAVEIAWLSCQELINRVTLFPDTAPASLRKLPVERLADELTENCLRSLGAAAGS